MSNKLTQHLDYTASLYGELPSSSFLGKLFQAVKMMATREEKQMKKIGDLEIEMKNIIESLDQIYKKDKEIMSTAVNNIAAELKSVKNR